VQVDVGESVVQAAPNTFNTALPVAQGQTIWREQFVLRERSDDGPMEPTGRTFRVAPVFGLTAPTGDHNARDRFDELPRPLQVGDGAWDGFARGDETRFVPDLAVKHAGCLWHAGLRIRSAGIQSRTS
jgi:hypothetical protein